MPRSKVIIPRPFLFKTEMNIRITDLNYGNHLANDKILALIHEARVRFLNSMSYSESDIESLGIIMADAVIEFKSQGFYGDKLCIKISVDNIVKKGFELFYEIENIESGKILGRIKTGIVFYNYKTQKPSNSPPQFVKKIERLKEIAKGDSYE